jgi:hypothetical protein
MMKMDLENLAWAEELLSLDFAEGKAIQRIREGFDESAWILVSEPGKEINVDELDNQLRDCGYID